jgi:hypothetical protein
MGDPVVVALLLAAAATAALVARLAFWLGGVRAWVLLLTCFLLLTAVNVTAPAFSDAARIASGAAIGFALGTVAGLVRFGIPTSRRPPFDSDRVDP